MSTATLDVRQRLPRVGIHDPNQRPPFNLARDISPLHRRLADAVDEAFQLALADDDLTAAQGLFDVLQKMRAREHMVRRVDRRHADPLIDLARRELESRKAGRRRNL